MMTRDELRNLLDRPDVAVVQPLQPMSVAPIPAAGDIPWHTDTLDPPAGDGRYAPAETGKGTYFATIDTGGPTRFSPHFPHLASECFSAVDDGDGCADGHGHGTHVSSTAVGVRDGNLPGGVATNAELIVVRVLRDNGGGTDEMVARGADWLGAYCMGQSICQLTVANLSLGGPASLILEKALCNLRALGVTVFVAAGNDGADATNSSPARLRDVVTVGATDQQNRRANFSNFGEAVDGFAPGVGITASNQVGQPWTISGTSMATPMEAAIGALCIEAGARGPAEVEACVHERGRSDAVGDPRGGVNRLACATCERTPDPSPTPGPGPAPTPTPPPGNGGGGPTPTPAPGFPPGGAPIPRWDASWSDGCSLPIVGEAGALLGPVTPRVRAVCVLHDEAYYYGGSPEDRALADAAFYAALEALGPAESMPWWRALLWYLGITVGGEPDRRTPRVSWAFGPLDAPVFEYTVEPQVPATADR